MADENGKRQGDNFGEIPVIIDRSERFVLDFVKGELDSMRQAYVVLPSSVPVRETWSRFKDSRRVVILWENRERGGGAIVEEILQISPYFDVDDRAIVLTSNPTREDIVYFAELGIKRIVRMPDPGSTSRQKAIGEFAHHFRDDGPVSQAGDAWTKLLKLIDRLGENPTPELKTSIEEKLETLGKAVNYQSARYLDAKASLAFAHGKPQEAEKLWLQAYDKNPNYVRAYHHLLHLYRSSGRIEDALKLADRLYSMNRNSISRLVEIGEIYLEKKDYARASHFFESALTRDRFASSALNGLAEVKFHCGEFEASRQLLAKSQVAYRVAGRLNSLGIHLVRENRFADAMELYTKAAFVLPHQDKGPLLFFNIGLCYHRWGKPSMAAEFLRLALVKEPKYKKARDLLDKIVATGPAVGAQPHLKAS